MVIGVEKSVWKWLEVELEAIGVEVCVCVCVVCTAWRPVPSRGVSLRSCKQTRQHLAAEPRANSPTPAVRGGRGGEAVAVRWWGGEGQDGAG